MSSSRTYWDRYVKSKGGVAGVVAKTKLPYSTIAGITNGHRGIGRDTAERLAKADRSLDIGKLLRVTPTKPARPRNRA